MAALTPYSQPEPFQDIASPAPPDELEEYYQQLERTELERRASKQRSRWSRKSVRGVDQHIEELQRARERRAAELKQRAQHTPEDSRAPTPEPAADEIAPGPPQHHMQHRTWAAAQPQPPLAATAPSGPPSKYELYNPAGPRYYTNHHLNPARSDAPGPTLFSKNFPAFPSTPDIPATAGQTRIRRSVETAVSPDQLGAPDGARLPQGKVRRRSPNSTPTEERGGQLPRNSSAPYGLNTRMTPSPLSQSVTTLPPSSFDPALEAGRLGRKLSKRKSSQPGAPTRFVGHSVDDVSQQYAGPAMSTTSLAPETHRPRPVSIATTAPAAPKRMSIFGKLAKKLSIAKPPNEPMVVDRRPGFIHQQSSSSSHLPIVANVATPGALQHPHMRSRVESSSTTLGSASTHYLSSNSSNAAQTSLSATTVEDRRTPSPAKREPSSESRITNDRPELPAMHSSSSGGSGGGLLHNGAYVVSPPADDAYSEPPGSQAVEPPQSDGRYSPDGDLAFDIGNLMITNPDYATSSVYTADTPRYMPLDLPPPNPRFQAPSIYSETLASASAASLKLQVINPSAPTPVLQPQELPRPERATKPPVASPEIPEELPPAAPQRRGLPPGASPPVRGERVARRTQSAVPSPPLHAPQPVFATAATLPSALEMTSPVYQQRANGSPPRESPPRSPERESPTRGHESRTGSDGVKSERRISRKPPPSVVPVLPELESITSLQSGASSRASQDADAIASYLTGPAKAAPKLVSERSRNVINVEGDAYEIVPVTEAAPAIPDDGPTPQRRTSRVAKLAVADLNVVLPRGPGQHVTREASTSSVAPALPPKSPDREPRNRSAAPAPPAKNGVRPTSNVFEGHDNNGLSARESYDLERMRKGVTVVGGVGGIPNGISVGHGRDHELPPPPVPSRDASSLDAAGQGLPRRQPSLGSGHTNFVMQPAIASRPAY